MPVLALSPDVRTVRRLGLSRGVYPRLVPPVQDLSLILAAGDNILLDAAQVGPGSKVVLVTGSRAAYRGGKNMIKIHTVGEED